MALALTVALTPSPGAATVDPPRAVFRVACLGDSNTAPADPPATGTVSWCERLVGAMARSPGELAVENHAAPGATVCEPKWDSNWARPQLDRALAGAPHVVIAAFGTNDLAVLYRTPGEIVECYAAIERSVPHGVPFLVALTPPGFDVHSWFAPGAVGLSSLLRARIPSARLVDFETGFAREHFHADGLHANDAGQRLRAERARPVLERAVRGSAAGTGGS